MYRHTCDRCCRTSFYSPCTRFRFTSCKVGNEAEKVIPCSYKVINSIIQNPVLLSKHIPILMREFIEFTLYVSINTHIVCPSLCKEIHKCMPPLIILFVKIIPACLFIEHVEYRLYSNESKETECGSVFLRNTSSKKLSCLKNLHSSFEHLLFLYRCLFPTLHISF